MWHKIDKYFIKVWFATLLMVLTILLLFIFKAEANYEKEYEVDLIKERVVMLALCESDYTSDAYVAHDPVTPSIGILQWKYESWEHFTNYYGLTLDIWNPEHQKILTYKMLADSRYEHWLTCSTKLGFLP